MNELIYEIDIHRVFFVDFDRGDGRGAENGVNISSIGIGTGYHKSIVGVVKIH